LSLRKRLSSYLRLSDFPFEEEERETDFDSPLEEAVLPREAEPTDFPDEMFREGEFTDLEE
jgi:hypothetical protein